MPNRAISRKQILHIPNCLMYPWSLPQILHLLRYLTLYFGFLFIFSICAFVAISGYYTAVASLVFGDIIPAYGDKEVQREF